MDLATSSQRASVSTKASENEGVALKKQSQETPDVSIMSMSATRGSREGEDRDPTDQYELRVQILAATCLDKPEYRVGDIMARLLGGVDALISSVYGEIGLGDRRVKSE